MKPQNYDPNDDAVCSAQRQISDPKVPGQVKSMVIYHCLPSGRDAIVLIAKPCLKLFIAKACLEEDLLVQRLLIQQNKDRRGI